MKIGDSREHKVLPFNLLSGCPVPGHAINVFAYYGRDGKPSFPRKVVFWTFDDEAKCSLELIVDVGDFTKWVHLTHRGHTVQAVILDDGTRIQAAGRHAMYGSDRVFNDAPTVARHTFGAVALMSKSPLVEVAGVREYLGSFGIFGDKTPDPSLILDPWERDNAISHAQLSQVTA